jgi:beta-lactam-binding protein with PASTA domain
VLAPPPPCVVPALASRTAFAEVGAQLTAAGCTVGPRRYGASRRYPRGALLRLSPRAGTALAPQAAVTVWLSSGAPCVVPRASGGLRLRPAQRKLRAAGCRFGPVRWVRSQRRRGTVVSFSPRSGARLAPRAAVTIRISRGRR